MGGKGVNAYVTRRQVRWVNRKLFAIDLDYSDGDNVNTFNALLCDVISNYDPEDKIQSVPTILQVKDEETICCFTYL